MAATIRRATVEDAATLAALGTATFVETFGHLYSPEDLQAFLDESHTVEAYAKVLANPDYALWIAERDGEAIGYAQAGRCGLPHADVQPGDGRRAIEEMTQSGAIPATWQDVAPARSSG